MMNIQNRETSEEELEDILLDIGAWLTNETLNTARLQALVDTVRWRTPLCQLTDLEASLFLRLLKLSPHQIRNVEIEFLVDDTQVFRAAPIGVLTRDGYK